MKVSELPSEVQVVAASILAAEVSGRIDALGEKRTEEAKKIAETVRIAFEELFKN